MVLFLGFLRWSAWMRTLFPASWVAWGVGDRRSVVVELKWYPLVMVFNLQKP